MPYTRDNYIRAWVRSVFGLMVAIMLLFIFNSAFLSLLTFIFLFFIPVQSSRTERVTNLIIFGLGMLIILFFAFGFGSFDIGLGLDLGIKTSFMHILFGGLLVLSILAKGWVSIQQTRGSPTTTVVVVTGSTNTMSTLFSVIILVLFIANVFVFAPWQWNVGAIIFMGVWMVSFLVGIFSDPQTRQPLGVLLIIISFVIFTLGIGSNIVGETAFGQWWPTMKDFGDNTIVPIVGALEGFVDTMKEGFRLISCPACVVQDIASGRFGRDSTTGLSGAYGVEFVSSPKITPVFPYMDYSITSQIKNEGSSDAKNVVVKLLAGTKTPQEAMDVWSASTYLNFINPDKLSLEELGFDSTTENISLLSKQQAISFDFSTNKQLSCETVNKYKLESKSIPLLVELQYDYSVTSTLPVEVFSKNKWDEEVRKGKVAAQKKPAELSNSPVKLNLDVGDQPRIEGTHLILSVQLERAKKDLGIKKATKIVLHYPQDLTWTKSRGCKGGVDGGNNTIIWYESFPQTGVTNCHFDLPTLNVPSTTFQFSAEAEYTVSTLRGFSEKMDWRTGCCSNSVFSGNF